MTGVVMKRHKKFTMSFYKINYKQLRQQPEISRMLSALERGFQKFDIDFYLVGAIARDVWMSAINNIEPRRTTGDIDFAVLINDKGTYDALKEYLIQKEGFHAYKGNAFVLIWKDKSQVDLLPFSSIEDEDGTVDMNDLGLTNISLQGFTEVYEEGLPQLELDEKHQFKFCTLPGIVLLKMLAWDDRPEKRRDDIKDISDILNHFFDMNDNEIYDHHNDLFAEESAELIYIAARVLGREMRKIAMRNDILFARIEKILDANTTKVSDSKIATIMVEYFQNTVEDNVYLLNQIKRGFLESQK
jgi:predicted nucleotidyltransferase